jgi:hypothetical protein
MEDLLTKRTRQIIRSREFRIIILMILICLIFYVVGYISGLGAGIDVCAEVGVKFARMQGINLTISDEMVSKAITYYRSYIGGDFL